MAGIVLSRSLFGIKLPRCTNAHSSSSRHSGKYHCGIKWHRPLLSRVGYFFSLSLSLSSTSARFVSSPSQRCSTSYGPKTITKFHMGWYMFPMMGDPYPSLPTTQSKNSAYLNHLDVSPILPKFTPLAVVQK